MKSLLPVALALCLVTAAPAQSPVSDFSLPDVNSGSLRRRTTAAELSPRQYFHQVTAWYFGNEG